MEIEKYVTCPHCAGRINVSIDYRVSAAHHTPILPLADAALVTETPAAPAGKWSIEEQAILAAAKTAGLFEPFVQTATVAKKGMVPKDMEGFLLTVLRTATQVQLPREALHQFRALFPQTFIAYFSGQGIGIVTADGCIQLFLPHDLTKSRKFKGIGFLQMNDTSERLEAWIRTKHGYVASPGALLDELRQSSPGAFALPGL